MVAEAWILKMGSQVSTNLKHAFFIEPQVNKKKKNPSKSLPPKEEPTIAILSFEVANAMSRALHLHRSLTEHDFSELKARIFASEGIGNLVSRDETRLLRFVLGEKLDELKRVSDVVSRLGKKCTEPALQGFEHVFGDIVNGVIDVKELGFLVKDMEGMVKKLERYVNTTSNLYCEMEVLNELEQATKKFQNNQHEESRRAFEQKLIWQKEEVRHLKEISLWNQSFDKVVGLLARTACTIYARILSVFGECMRDECGECLGKMMMSGCNVAFHSGFIDGVAVEKRDTSVKSRVDSWRGDVGLFRAGDRDVVGFSCGTSPGRLLMDCLSLSGSGSRLDDDNDGLASRGEKSSEISGCCSFGNVGLRREQPSYSGCFNRPQSFVSFNGDRRQARFGPKSRLTVHAPPSTVGGAALALHYANVIIVIEKLLQYPHLVGEEARDDLYHMLPTSLRMSLRTNLKSYVKNLAIYDAPLAHDWKETLDGILRWLVPLAHNMIRWQCERNFEQNQIVTRTNVLLVQTLYFADREKTEAAICELLVGLNYICRYEQQQNALLDCASSFDFEDCMRWQMQCRAAFVD